MKFYSIGEFSKLIGRTPQTLSAKPYKNINKTPKVRKLKKKKRRL